MPSITKSYYRGLFFLLLWSYCGTLQAKCDRFRYTWRQDPATSAVIGWDQVSGSNPVLYYDVVDHGTNLGKYPYAHEDAVLKEAKGMRNYFARLTHLKPNTVYYFVIKDSEGISERFSFRTAPDNPDTRLSIISGGDSRNRRGVRQKANSLVSKLRPHAILFSGDMTGGDSSREWQEWLDDWQLTIGSDGRLFPVLAARGNHEASNKVIEDIFDTPSPDAVYALNLGGDLVRVYTLNSLLPAGGQQKAWLEKDLAKHQHSIWRFAQYHHAIRPHTAGKSEKTDMLINWATLFHKYKVQLGIESDSHVCKWTYPVKPSRKAGSDEGFIRDDQNGTVYVGEGCWGAPLRQNNDDKNWTRASGSFNQFKWIFVDRDRVEVRTVKTDAAEQVAELDDSNLFDEPVGLVLWRPKTGPVLVITNHKVSYSESELNDELEASVGALEIKGASFDASPAGINIRWSAMDEPGQVLYEVQRSVDGGKTFSSIREVAGTGTVNPDYAWMDKTATYNTLLRYRIKYRVAGQQAKYVVVQPAPRRKQESTVSPGAVPRLQIDPNTHQLRVKYDLAQGGNVLIRLIRPGSGEVSRVAFADEAAGPHLKSLDMRQISRGQYFVEVSVNGEVIRRYRVNR